MKISLFTLILREKTLDEALKQAHEIGFDGVELWGGNHFPADTTMERTRQIKRMLDEYQLEVPSVGSYIGNFSTKSDDDCEKEYEGLEKYLNLMQILGCDLIRVGCGGPNAFLAQSYHYEKALYWIQKCADLACKYKSKIAMEIHNGSLIETVDDASRLLKMIDRSNVGVIHDAGNMYITDTDYGARSVAMLKDKIFHVHVKDELRIEDDKLPGAFHDKTVYGNEIFQQKMLGEGAVDHLPLFMALVRLGYKGHLSLECHAAVTDTVKARHDFDEIKKQVRLAESEFGN
jgi:L-ribulose-5-phosphate 3-epimerase